MAFAKNLIVAVICGLLCTPKAYAYINNFRFKHSNVFTGNVLPFRATISGTYYLDVRGTPQLAYISWVKNKDVINAQALSAGTDLPVVCHGNTAAMIASQNADTHTNLKKKLVDLAKIADGPDSGSVRALIASWGPYIPIVDDYECTPIKLTPSPKTPGGFTFKVTVEFKEHKPVIFMDALGMGMFNYKRSYSSKHAGHSSGNPIRFCGGSAYTGDMFTIEPRPKCPITSNEKNRHHGRAIITVYKPNIVSVRRNVTRCLQRITHVHAYENVFGTSRDSWRKTWNVNTSPRDCREWKKEKSACKTFIRASEEEGDEMASVFLMFYNLNNNYYRQHNETCVFTKKFSQNLAANEFETTPYLDYDYSAGSIHSYDMRSATLSEGFMEVAMPTATMVTPWANIPKEYKYKDSYQVNNVTFVWEAFTPDDLCMYVPRFRGDVTYIKYKHGDFDVPIDPTSNQENYTLFLVAEQYGALFNVDSSQEIKDVSNLNCMPHVLGYNTKFYQVGSDQIIMVTMTDDGLLNHHEESHIPEDMRHVGVEEQVHGAFSSIHYDASSKKVLKVEKDNELTTTKPTQQGVANKTHDLETHFNSVRKSNGPEDPEIPEPPLPPKDATITEALAYINFKNVETQKHNIHVRAVQNCFINQLDWDVYTQLLDLNPSRAISNRINVAVEASMGGNGFYNVKRCELALDTVVIPTLRTNSEERVSVNNKEFTVKDIVRHMGVSPDPEKCFAMPLVVFRSRLTGTQIVGQVTLEGVINTQRLAYLEACTADKSFIFMINDYGHFFHDYKATFTDTSDNIRNATEKFLVASSGGVPPGEEGSSLADQQARQHALSKVHILSIVQPANLRENEYKHFSTGLFNNDIYSLAEHQSTSLGLMKLMEEQNFERFAAREFAAEFTSDRRSHDNGLFYGMGNIIEGAGSFFQRMGEGEGGLLYGLGGGAGQLLKGAGEGVGAAGKGIFGGIGDALSGTFMALGLPLIAVAVLAIVGVIIYKQLSGSKTAPSDLDNPPPYQEHQYYQQSKPSSNGGGANKRSGFVNS